MINWTVRIKNKNFWLTLIPAAILLVQAVAALFGFQLELEGIQQQILDIVNAAFAVLAVLGIVTDPTTKGIGDSEQALTYDKPKE